VEVLRANVENLSKRMRPPPPGVKVTPVQEAGVTGEWVEAPGLEGSGRVLVFLHGGGYVSGTLALYRGLAWQLSRAARARVLVLDYRLAPEHPYPAALEDTVTAYSWLLSLGHEPTTVGFAGDSAGGGLVLSTLVKLRDEGLRRPGGACCFSPWTDLAMTGESIQTNRDADPMILAEVMRPTVNWYLGPAAPTTPTASPLYADLRGLPPVLLQVGSSEVLLDDSRRFAQKLRAAGGEAELQIWPDMPHVWHLFAPFLPEANRALDEAGRFLAARLRAASGARERAA
jgi:acetyl esterase/lipase